MNVYGNCEKRRTCLFENWQSELKVSAPFLSDVELGRRHPSEEVLARVAKKLDATVEELKKHDSRAPVQELKRIVANDPKMGFALRQVVDEGVSAEDLLRVSPTPRQEAMKTYRTTAGPFAEKPFFKPEEIEQMCRDELARCDLYPTEPMRQYGSTGSSRSDSRFDLPMKICRPAFLASLSSVIRASSKSSLLGPLTKKGTRPAERRCENDVGTRERPRPVTCSSLCLWRSTGAALW